MIQHQISKEFLIQKYCVEKLSFRSIAKIVGCGKTTIEKRIKEYKIKPRTCSETMRLNNPMKHQCVRDKVSKWRKNMPPEIRQKYSDAQKKCWESGKFDNVRVGQCRWFEYKKRNGKVIKLQGTWEYGFAKWADEKGLNFDAHKGRISYVLNGKTKNYYPDFFIYDWNCYVEIKNKYHMNLQKQKFIALRKSNPNLKLLILMRKELEKLGAWPVRKERDWEKMSGRAIIKKED